MSYISDKGNFKKHMISCILSHYGGNAMNELVRHFVLSKVYTEEVMTITGGVEHRLFKSYLKKYIHLIKNITDGSDEIHMF